MTTLLQITFSILCGLQIACALQVCNYNGQIYQNGDTFNSSDGCNICNCLVGQVSCTERGCLGPACLYNGSWYITGDTFNATDNCNTCNCMNGSVSCTEMYCPQKDGCVYNGVHYDDGSSYDSMDGCNKCFCFGNQTACTERACITTPPPTPAPTCTYYNRMYKDNQSFKSVDGCNTCTCQAGIVGCTEMACLGHVASENGASCLYSGLFFDHGSSFTSTDGCNQCTCKQGTVHCTTYPCPTTVPMDPDHCYVNGKMYNVGDSYPAPDGCNACFCGGNNTGGCTQMFCLGPVGRSVAESHCDYNGVTYKSGDHFNATDGCNHCFCAGDVPVCTKMWCGPLLPKQKKAVSSNICYYEGHSYHAGDHFKSSDGCNTCGCSPGGFPFCTEMFCGPISTRETKPCVYNGLTYSAGDNFKDKDGCNSCGCTSSGLVICTLMACLNHDIDIIHQKKETPLSTCNYEGVTYLSGQRFQHNDGCNTCSCSKTGHVLCTYKSCPPQINLSGVIKKEKVSTCDYEGATYLAGQRFQHNDGCNTCSCSKTGRVLCTYKSCPPKINVSSAIKRETKPCVYNGLTYNAGDNFKDKDGCNSCGCTSSGLVFCTEMACLNHDIDIIHQKREEVSTCDYEGVTYSAGQRFQHNDRCNTCSCSKTGHVLCTYKSCPPQINLSGVIKREEVSTCDYEGVTYLAGQRFQHNDGCNTCSCSKTGHVLCTYKSCPPQINLSGVIKREEVSTCDYEGVTYLAGQRFQHNDGCNTCSCSKTGHVLCTYKSCPPEINLSGVIKREEVSTCDYEGVTYSAGQRFQHNDGCNTCSCSKTGHVLCTYKSCPPQIYLSGVIKREKVSTCDYEGATYLAGQRFQHSDGCNTCSCSKTGHVLCTYKSCPPQINLSGVIKS